MNFLSDCIRYGQLQVVCFVFRRRLGGFAARDEDPQPAVRSEPDDGNVHVTAGV